MAEQPVVEVRDVIVKYGDKTVLNGVTTSFMASTINAILGTSGCGKTTLLKTIIGLLKPASGSVRIFGEEVHEPDMPRTMELLKRIGVLFQNGALLGSLTVGQNIALPLEMHTALPEKIIEEIVHLKLSQVDMPHTENLYPGELSGGMRKRAALARALVLEPPLVLCDEPSAGLDPVTASGLDDLLLKLREKLGITIVVVTHELASIDKIAGNVLFLHDGMVLVDGTLDEAKRIDSGPVYNFFNRLERVGRSSHGHAVRFNVENVI